MTNRLYNLPESIISKIYEFDSTFHDIYDITIMEMEFLMDEPEEIYSEYSCCAYCNGDFYRYSIEGDRTRRFFNHDFIQDKKKYIAKKREMIEKKERIRLENIELNLLELLRRERNFVLDEIHRNKNRTKNNKKKIN